MLPLFGGKTRDTDWLSADWLLCCELGDEIGLRVGPAPPFEYCCCDMNCNDDPDGERVMDPPAAEAAEAAVGLQAGNAADNAEPDAEATPEPYDPLCVCRRSLRSFRSLLDRTGGVAAGMLARDHCCCCCDGGSGATAGEDGCVPAVSSSSGRPDSHIGGREESSKRGGDTKGAAISGRGRRATERNEDQGAVQRWEQEESGRG